MKYKDIDWSVWDDTPEEDAYIAWLAVRKLKRSATTQRAIKLAGKHVNKLIAAGYSATEVLDIAIEKSWAGLEWVFELEQKKGFKRVQYTGNIEPIRSTRDIPLEEELGDTRWADDI